MPRTENDDLSSKVQSIANTFGKNISLIYNEDKAIASCNAFKALAIRTQARYKVLVKEVAVQKHITHEIESIFDNFFVVESAIFEIKNNLRKDDFKKLPLVSLGKGVVVPRLYHILSKLVVETNRLLDKELIEKFLSTYQEHSPLSIRELYAIPSILQIIFTEHFGMLIEKAISSVKEYEEANEIALKIKSEIGKKDSRHFSKTISWLASTHPLVPKSLGFYLLQSLSQESSSVRPIIRWLKLNFEKQGIDTRNLIDLENKQRSENSTLASNIIESLHWLTQARWENIVENVNIVDNVLSKDPSGAYSLMDLDSKNQYRRVIVKIAETAGVHEAEVARTAVRLAQQSLVKGANHAEIHVGFYLIDEGRYVLEKRINYKPTIKDNLYRLFTKNAQKFYFGSVLLINFLITALATFFFDFSVIISLLFFFLISEVSLSLVNVLIARFLPVRRMPELDLSKTISSNQRAFVVIPTMFRNENSIKETVRKLEIRFLGNQQENIYYALLFDFKDSKEESLASDSNLVSIAEKEIYELNGKYNAGGEPKFFFLYRKRQWNESEGVYMGWERKRGKLREFNMLLRGGKNDNGGQLTYVNPEVIYKIKDFQKIKYVITLDEDTELPKDSARRLIGCIDHPLNRPVLGDNKKVLRGYGIVQPRVSMRLATASKSIYSRLYSATSGIDSYSTAVSDLYQDLFGNALFFGKGIYDIDAVEKSMKNEIPDNLVLSHDLLEGVYARTGYASGVVLFDGFPNFYHEFALRMHRWIRGDWQIIGWIFKRNGFSFTDRFKIFDNLRRSLIPVFALAFVPFIVFGNDKANYLSFLVILALSSSFLFGFLNDVLSIKRISFRIRFKDSLNQIRLAAVHILFRVVFLVHHAYIAVSAVIKTLWRLFISKKLLLEWQSSTDVGGKLVGKLKEFYRTMLVTQVFSGFYILYSYKSGRIDISILILALLTLLSPLIAFYISRTKKNREILKTKDLKFLRSMAYRTSRYFIDLSRKENNWLIQDHYQEYPRTSETDKLTTSPTNIGMLFASLFSSYELGFISFDRFVDRTRKALNSISKLERYKGHLLNWYDIERLETLNPAYLSSVDSANFIMALMAFRQGVKELKSKSIINKNFIKGVSDGLYCVIEEIDLALAKKYDSRDVRNTIKKVKESTLSVYNFVLNSKEPKNTSDFVKILALIHPKIISIEKTLAHIKNDESIKYTEQIIISVEHITHLIEDELAFQRYVLPHIHNKNTSVEAYVSKDQNLLNAYRKIISIIEAIPTFNSMALEVADSVKIPDFKNILNESKLSSDSKEYVMAWYDTLIKDVNKAQSRVKDFIKDTENIIKDCDRFIDEPDFEFLYNRERGLFHIGYNVTYSRLDNACYNFLASESNSVSFVAILKNQVPQKHWFYLGRKLVQSSGFISLVSWGGSLFEYLTSLIYFKAHEESLLGKTAMSAINIHKRHGLVNRIPWGMGESAYYMFDSGKHYQYQVFGSPEIGLKRGLADYMVIAPYVSALSLSFVTSSAISNLKRMVKLGASGFFGFFDAMDYMNEERIRTVKPLKTKIYYAHHQGFTLLGIHNLLDKDRLRNLFHSDPRVASVEILLEEKMPSTPAATKLSIPARLPFTATQGVSDKGTESRQYIPIKTPYPHLALLGNGNYSVAISNAGAGLSKYKDIALTRFRDEPLLEESGMFIYIKNEKTQNIWSPSNRPAGGDSKHHKVIFHENKAEFYATNGNFSSKLDVTVDKVNPVEIRSLSISNNGNSTEKITISSYGELSLATQSQDMHHPQYQKLSVKSVFLKEYNALVYSRPHPLDRTKKIHFAHMLSRGYFKKDTVTAVADRSLFIGRSRSFRDPIFFDQDLDSVKQSPVKEYTLDPIFSLSKKIDVKSGETVKFTFVNIATEDENELLKLIKEFSKNRKALSVIAGSISSSAESTKSLGITQEMAVNFQRIASKALSGRQYDLKEVLNIDSPYINSVWKLGISGDYPIVTIVIKDIEDIQNVKHALLCHAYWKYKGIQIDLVILNNEPASYIKVLDDEIDFLLRQSRSSKPNPTGSSVYHVKSDLIEETDKKVLLHVSRVVLDSKDGTFKQQIQASLKKTFIRKYPAKYNPSVKLSSVITKQKKSTNTTNFEHLEFRNKWGGFDSSKSEYVIQATSSSLPPVPWSNVITSPDFGTVVSDSGAMFTWSKDSYDNRITTWNNDPVVFKSSEIIYLRDEETGEVWNPTPLPIRTKNNYVIKHGKGYSIFEHSKNNLDISMKVSVSHDKPIKIVTLSIKNNNPKKKNISQTVFLEPAMNIFRDHTRDFIDFSINQNTGAIFFKQVYRNKFSGHVSFADMCGGDFSFTTDKTEFLGRHGSYEHPLALKRVNLSNLIVPGTMNCVALQSFVTLESKEEKEVTFILGEADSVKSAEDLIIAFRGGISDPNYLAPVKNYWSELLGKIEINTPDRALDIMFNHQLLYQLVSSRVWAKTGLYQPSGAFGFRDQLQDVTALIWSDPGFVRKFILMAATHQFKEGDALNWWHDHNMFGVRTVLSDHQLWLVYATLEYVSVTGDKSILDEQVSFLESPVPSFAYQKEWTGVPKISSEKASLYEHCVRALNKSSVFGQHGLPLIGMGDWNDGLSNAGTKGRGESVWSGWFIVYLMNRFSNISRDKGLIEDADRYTLIADSITKSIESHAWDGKWYRRAFLDSGIVVGSKRLKEFRIDSIAQSWAEISGIAREERSKKALESMFDELYDGDAMKLLSPALSNSMFDPGYLKDYPPGVRENGSQYNHAALWASQAMFKAGMPDKAKKILDSVNPIKRSLTDADVLRYRSEPYVVASDVYANPSYKGRGGWTWYTGSAGVMYRTILTSLLGIKVEGNYISFHPSLPTDWENCSIKYKKGQAIYNIEYTKPKGVEGLVVEVYENDKLIEDKKILMKDDGKVHNIKVVLQAR